MPRTPQKGTTVRVDEDHYEILRKLAKRTGFTHNKIFERILDITDSNDLLRPDWEKRLTASLKRGQWIIQWKKHLASNDDCEGLRGADQKWKCIQGRKNQTPMIRILAEDYDEARNMCSGCTITKARTAETEGLREEVSTLQHKLKQKADIVYRIPICKASGLLVGDGSGFTRCDYRRTGAVDIEKFCKLRNQGKGCDYYNEVVVGVGAKVNV